MKTIYQRIRDAAKLGRGLRLTPEEVGRLTEDDAITTRATLDDEEESRSQGDLPKQREE